MHATVSLPAWAFVLLAALAGWAVLDRLLKPALNAVLRRRANRVIDELNTRLPLRIPSFKLTKREVLVDQLLFDPKVLEAAEAFARETGAPREDVQKRVARYAAEIVPAFNAWIYFRAGYAAARALARTLYRVRIGSADDAGLAAIPDGSAVVFVMNHRSNMDYILLSYLAAERTALSYAVGEWARIWPIQSLVRATGAYFVRRDSNDPLYRRVLERYVAMATAHGVPQAVYPEGGLTRDGALRPPKLGLLDYMIRGFDPNGTRDLVFVPVGVNYDRVLEDRTLLLDRSPAQGRASLLETIGGTLRFLAQNLRLLVTNDWHRFGYACVSFGTPVSTKTWLKSRSFDLSAASREERFAAVQALAEELMARIARIIPVLPVSLVSAVFTAEPGRARSEIELKAEVLARWRELGEAGVEVYVPRGDQDYAVTFGLRTLLQRHLVTAENGLFRAVPGELPLLRYYANAIARAQDTLPTRPAS
ncbi:MAG TPA: 1-acyl-sn-glycerol-3-phosphate acyltransferase [Thermoanaerobaculia bacterium]|nr:1-acyl-sn-glycerol-3-phosphate acyltransferase [Thermoanaerobaculia bacterium]